MKNFSRVLALVTLAAAPLAGCSSDDNVIVPGFAYDQIDRMAIPAVNTALIPAAQKEAYNRASPRNDVANYRTTVVNTITALRANAASRGMGAETGTLTPAQLADIVMPDVVTVDFSQTVAFPNGRDLDDDVIDTVLSLVLNRTVSDAVPEDNTNLSAFPYLGTPNPLPVP